jgi:hypothetical protein
MAKQRYNTSIDSLSYAKSYVTPLLRKILSLLDSRANRYLKSKLYYLATELVLHIMILVNLHIQI